MEVRPTEEVKCTKCGKIDIARNMIKTRPASPMIGTPAEWICVNCDNKMDGIISQHTHLAYKRWSSVGRYMKEEHEK